MSENMKMVLSEEEKEKIINNYIKDGKLNNLPNNKQKREIVIEFISKVFDRSREYTEREVNSILLDVYDDIFLIRRELVEWGFMNRTRDGRSYWINTERE